VRKEICSKLRLMKIIRKMIKVYKAFSRIKCKKAVWMIYQIKSLFNPAKKKYNKIKALMNQVILRSPSLNSQLSKSKPTKEFLVTHRISIMNLLSMYHKMSNNRKSLMNL